MKIKQSTAEYVLQMLSHYIQLMKDEQKLIKPQDLEFMIKQFEFDYKASQLNSNQSSKFKMKTNIGSEGFKEIKEMNKKVLKMLREL